MNTKIRKSRWIQQPQKSITCNSSVDLGEVTQQRTQVGTPQVPKLGLVWELSAAELQGYLKSKDFDFKASHKEEKTGSMTIRWWWT